MKELSSKVGAMEFDGLITDINPHIQVRGTSVASINMVGTVIKRGTVLAESVAAETCTLLGDDSSTLEELYPNRVASYILCDDVTIAATVTEVTVYSAGCFDPNKISVSEGYTMTATDKDELRIRGIVFKSASDAN